MDWRKWSVTLEAADAASAVDVNAEALEALVEKLDPFGGVVTGGGRRYGATFDVAKALDAPMAIKTAAEAFDKAVKSVGLPRWPIVTAHAQTWEDQELELARPVTPELVGVAEAAAILGIPRQRVSQLLKASNPPFPRPVQFLKATPVWTSSSIERFGELWVRKSGRPARTVIEVSPLRDGRWEVRHRDGEVIEGVDPFDTREDAVKWARVIANLAKPSQLLVRDEAGRILENLRFVKTAS